MKPPRLRLSVEEVMAQSAKLPALVQHMFLDGEWIWYCGPSLAGADNKPVREALKEIGFRFAMSGHRMRDPAGNQTNVVGTWGHSCQRPLPPRRRSHQGEPASEPTTADLIGAL